MRMNHRAISNVLLMSLVAAILSVLAGACTLVYPTVRVGPSFRVRVTDRGRPVQGLRLKLASYDETTSKGNDIGTITDADGVTQFNEVIQGSFVLMVDHDAGIADAVNIDVARGVPSGVTVPLKWPSKKPLQVRTVSGALRDPLRPRRFSLSLLEGLSARVIQTTDTDGKGQFTFPNVPPGIYFLELNPFGVQTESRRQEGDLIAIDVSNEAEDKKLDLDVGWSTCGLSYTDRSECSHAEMSVESLCGKVVDSTGAVISKADVLLMESSQTQNVVAQTLTDVAGGFALPDSRNGTYQLVVRSPGFYPLQQAVRIQSSQASGECSQSVNVRLALFGSCSSAQLVSSAQPHAAPTPPGNYLNVGGVKLWYEECGSQNSPGVVLLHDGLMHSITWDGIWPALCAKYHVVRYDRRGYGRSEPAKAPFVPEDDLLKIMRQVHMTHAILVGNSSGGGLALDSALAHPEMVDGLFLIGPVVHGMATSDYFNERGSRNSAPLDRGDDKAAAENWSKDRFLLAGNDPPARKQLYDGLSQNPQNLKVGGGLEVRPSPPTVVRLSEIHVPTLVLVGDADIADVFAYSGAIEAAVPLASFEVWKDTGHLIQLQRPAELVTRFNRFVSSAERKEMNLTDRQLGVYVGWYKLGNRLASVTLKNNRLLVEIPGNPYYWLFAASEAKFFLRTEESEIEFQKDASGKVAEMVVHNSDGSVIRCPRVENGNSQ